MTSFKPGRGPSKRNAAASILVALFGVFWCIAAGVMGAWIMIPFGLVFIGIAVSNAIYHHHNATAEDRYSVFDVVDSREEPDPLNERYGRGKNATENAPGYCPYCGRQVSAEFAFCPFCGRALPR